MATGGKVTYSSPYPIELHQVGIAAYQLVQDMIYAQ